MKKITNEEIDILLNDENLKIVPDAFDESKEIAVSVFCLTFNQEKYIRDALDSFLMQKVNFNVEIVIHDDASSDSTPKILDEYASKYPNVIKVFKEIENQYSKVGDTIEIERLHIKNTRGKYIASCEGDDYWSDPFKLLIQKAFLDRNPQINYSAHKVKVIDLLDERRNTYLPTKDFNSCSLSEEEFADLVNDGYPFQTSSYFMRKASYEKFLSDYPEYAQIIPTSDESVMYYFANNGGAIYINRTMSCWRKFTENSWNCTLMNSTSAQQNYRRRKFSAGIMKYYDYSGRRFKSCIDRANRLMITTYLSENNLKALFKEKSMRKILKKDGLVRYYKLKIKSLLQKNNEKED